MCSIVYVRGAVRFQRHVEQGSSLEVFNEWEQELLKNAARVNAAAAHVGGAGGGGGGGGAPPPPPIPPFVDHMESWELPAINGSGV